MDTNGNPIEIYSKVQFGDSDDWDSEGIVLRLSPSGRYCLVLPLWGGKPKPFWSKSEWFKLA